MPKTFKQHLQEDSQTAEKCNCGADVSPMGGCTLGRFCPLAAPIPAKPVAVRDNGVLYHAYCWRQKMQSEGRSDNLARVEKVMKVSMSAKCAKCRTNFNTGKF
jgi:hypothetical protein